MPKVGGKKFSYTKKGMSDAKKYAKKKGMDIDIGGKKKNTGRRKSARSGMSKMTRSKRKGY